MFVLRFFAASHVGDSFIRISSPADFMCADVPFRVFEGQNEKA